MERQERLHCIKPDVPNISIPQPACRLKMTTAQTDSRPASRASGILGFHTHGRLWSHRRATVAQMTADVPERVQVAAGREPLTNHGKLSSNTCLRRSFQMYLMIKDRWQTRRYLPTPASVSASTILSVPSHLRRAKCFISDSQSQQDGGSWTH